MIRRAASGLAVLALAGCGDSGREPPQPSASADKFSNPPPLARGTLTRSAIGEIEAYEIVQNGRALRVRVLRSPDERISEVRLTRTNGAVRVRIHTVIKRGLVSAVGYTQCVQIPVSSELHEVRDSTGRRLPKTQLDGPCTSAADLKPFG